VSDPIGPAARGVAAMVGACVIWGLSSIYYKALDDVPAPEVLAHRAIWSVVFFLGVLAVQGRLGVLRALLADRAVGVVALAAIAISTNWGLFIFAVQSGRALEGSLGYYVFPLLAVLLGVGLYRERLSGLQVAAVALAALAVLVLTLGLGTAPWIALALAGTFACYGIAKRRVAAGPVVSVTAEVVLMAPLALAWLAGVHLAGWQVLPGAEPAAFGRLPRETALLVAAGPITATPLILFSYASKRIGFATQGLVQYLNPTLQFAVAVALFGEVFTPWHALAFPMIWLALALYSFSAWRRDRAARAARLAAVAR